MQRLKEIVETYWGLTLIILFILALSWWAGPTDDCAFSGYLKAACD